MEYNVYEGKWLATTADLRFLMKFDSITAVNDYIFTYINIRKPNCTYTRYVPHPVFPRWTVVDYGNHSAFLFIEHVDVTNNQILNMEADNESINR